MEIEKVLKLLKFNGFKVRHTCSEGAVVLDNDSMRVGIFPHDYPHSVWAGHILAEHEDNFDKWSKHYYRVSMPENAKQLKTILHDLRYIDNAYDKEFGNNFGTIVRSF